MKDMSLIILILVFWGSLIFITNAIASDPLGNYNSRYISDNNTMRYGSIDTSNFNITSDDPVTGVTSGKSFLNMLVKIFTFRIPSDTIPEKGGFLISFFNWLLLVIFGILIYRQVRSGGG